MSSLVAPPPLPSPEDPSLGLAPRLPRPFLRSLRTLFEILDEQGCGAVHVSEIESRWGRGGPGLSSLGGPQSERLPSGVLPALQQVAGPSGGYLSFPRLVAGLRIALLRDQATEGPAAEPAETRHNSAQERRSAGRTREGEPRGVTRSRSINSDLGQTGRPRSLRAQEPRRHTISHGVDYEALQRRRAAERERDALLQGLELAERLRGWYRRHLLEAQHRQQQEGAEPQDYFPDSSSNQSCLLLARIQEVNLGLRNLLATSPGQADVPPCFPFGRSGAPLFQAGTKQEFHQQTMNVLKEQNHLLIKEVSEKSDRIAQLEQEKAALCKQLQESRGYRLPSHKESTFI